ncbi:MAG: hypothetical protein K8R21_07125, partial [Leptospira sp.]|nr:hypothetical protein [Leptospira sp.]
MKVFFLIFLFPFLGLPASPFNGWETGKGFATLFMEGRRVFDSKERPRSLPEFPENKKIEFALLVSEYYLRQGDKEGVAGIIYLLRSGNKNYRLADYLLSSLWKLRKNDVPG